MTPLPAATPLKPGSAVSTTFNFTEASIQMMRPVKGSLLLIFQTFPFFGVEPAILNEHGEEVEGEAEGYLVSLDDLGFIYLFLLQK